MGIFAKRNIKMHEELTFNYNVDRYGLVFFFKLSIYQHKLSFVSLLSHQAQTCYCGEPNCVGFIGGKTQTDIATMDDLFLDGERDCP
jgi:histone-lysine N-methyltransferase SETD2